MLTRSFLVTNGWKHITLLAIGKNVRWNSTQQTAWKRAAFYTASHALSSLWAANSIAKASSLSGAAVSGSGFINAGVSSLFRAIRVWSNSRTAARIAAPSSLVFIEMNSLPDPWDRVLCADVVGGWCFRFWGNVEEIGWEMTDGQVHHVLLLMMWFLLDFVPRRRTL